MPTIEFLIVLVISWYFGIFESMHAVLALITIVFISWWASIFVTPIVLGIILAIFELSNDKKDKE